MYTSAIVVTEAAAGYADAARRRAQWMEGVSSLTISDEATALARQLVQAAHLPSRAAVDALHISVAACHGMHYLLTWNSTHVTNAEFRPKVERACRDNGYEPPVLCTPDELMGTDHGSSQTRRLLLEGSDLLQTVGDRPGKAGDRFFDELEWYARALRMARSLGMPY